MNPILFKDFYKVGHIEQYPEGTELVFSNFTPRKPINGDYPYAILFGLRYLIIKYLINDFNREFFSKSPEQAEKDYREFMLSTLGVDKPYPHIRELNKLGYLPIEIYALPEGVRIPFGVPAVVMYNTKKEFYWVTNMLETLLSSVLWGGSMSATTASVYRTLLDKFNTETSDLDWFVDYQAHDFSFRGMMGVEAAALSGAGHLNFFKGTDTIPAILLLNKYYGKDLSCGTSVNATEHSVMSAGGKEEEISTYSRLITEVYPKGIVSIVSDTWDLWHVIDYILPKLKAIILNRDGKVVIRPDSGDPVKIICGDPESSNETARKGLIQRLYEVFGGVKNSKGYIQLDEHIGAIYGDSITLDRAKRILQGLKEKGFASSNIVFGIGSYTYQYVTRDTLGWAMKATYCEVNGKGKAITKNPITDTGTKKSHSGILKVIKIEGSHGNTYQVLQNQTWEDFYKKDNELKLVFKNGELINKEVKQ